MHAALQGGAVLLLHVIGREEQLEQLPSMTAYPSKRSSTGSGTMPSDSETMVATQP